MRLHSLTGATAVDAPEGRFVPDEDGWFTFPDPLAARLHSSHVKGRKQWEDEIERQDRLHGEEYARRQDPATLYNAVGEIANIVKQLAGLQLAAAPAPADGDADKPATRRRSGRPAADA